MLAAETVACFFLKEVDASFDDSAVIVFDALIDDRIHYTKFIGRTSSLISLWIYTISVNAFRITKVWYCLSILHTRKS